VGAFAGSALDASCKDVKHRSFDGGFAASADELVAEQAFVGFWKLHHEEAPDW